MRERAEQPASLVEFFRSAPTGGKPLVLARNRDVTRDLEVVSPGDGVPARHEHRIRADEAAPQSQGCLLGRGHGRGSHAPERHHVPRGPEGHRPPAR